MKQINGNNLQKIQTLAVELNLPGLKQVPEKCIGWVGSSSSCAIFK